MANPAPALQINNKKTINNFFINASLVLLLLNRDYIFINIHIYYLYAIAAQKYYFGIVIIFAKNAIILMF